MSNRTSASGDQASVSSGSNPHNPLAVPPQAQPAKRKRNLPGNPDPDAEVVSLSPKTLLATNRFMCEICNKGFQRDQNLQLHRRGHNLPWKLKQRTTKEIRKKVYVCPEPSCVHHDPSRALGDLTGIKKHYYRKHGEKKWKCEKCSKRYAVQSDWKAHSKTCGSREYRCDCGTLFSRRDSFITHRAFCDALAEETASAMSSNPHLLSATTTNLQMPTNQQFFHANVRPEVPSWLACSSSTPHHIAMMSPSSSSRADFLRPNPNTTGNTSLLQTYTPPLLPPMSATALLQRATQMGAARGSMSSSMGLESPGRHHQDIPSNSVPSLMGRSIGKMGFGSASLEDAFVSAVIERDGGLDDSLSLTDHGAGVCEGLTRDFLGLRHLSQTDILAMAAGLAPHENSSQTPKPSWL